VENVIFEHGEKVSNVIYKGKLNVQLHRSIPKLSITIYFVSSTWQVLNLEDACICPKMVQKG
jgi:hypothetical protein